MSGQGRPAQNGLDNFPYHTSWNEGCGASLVNQILLAVLIFHAMLFAARERVVTDQHDEEEEEVNEPWPVKDQAETGDCKAEVLGVADVTIKQRCRDALPHELHLVKIGRMHNKRHDSNEGQVSRELDQIAEPGRPRRGQVRDKEFSQPEKGGMISRPRQNRRIRAGEIGRKWARHEDHLGDCDEERA